MFAFWKINGKGNGSSTVQQEIIQSHKEVSSQHPQYHRNHSRCHGVRRCTCKCTSHTPRVATNTFYNQVHFALSSQANFSASGDGVFPYVIFYQNIVQYVECIMDDEDREDLKDWWNK